MFPCACSLRSTQCAALIALAAAAGIMRIEPVPAPVAEPAIPQPISQNADLGNREQPTEFRAAVEIFRLQIRRVLEQIADCDALETCGTLSGLSAVRRPGSLHLVSPEAIPSARQHSFPFAIGPPEPPATLNARADDTEVSRDPAARRTVNFQVAVCLFPPFAALLQRDPVRTTELVDLAFDPSFGLRVEPESVQPRLSSISPAALRRCGADFATQPVRPIRSSESVRASFCALRSVPRLPSPTTGRFPINALGATASCANLRPRQSVSFFS